MSDFSKVPEDLDDLLEILKDNIFATLNCIEIGRIEKVTPGEQTAEISLQVKRRIGGGAIRSYPILVDCPIVILQGGGAYLDMPVSVGDYCLVLFNDRNIDTWWSTANVKEPPTLRKHSLSDGIALVGVNPVTSALTMDGTVVRLLGKSGPSGGQFTVKGETFRANLNTFLSAVVSATATVGTSAQNAAALAAIGTAATAFINTLPASFSTEVKIG